MGGQDGFSRDLLNYNDESNTLVAGVRIHPDDRWKIGLSLGWTASEAEIDPFDLSADDYVATHPTMSFEFSQSHTYSDLEYTRLDADLDINYSISDDFWLGLEYKYIDWADDAPYLFDSTGTVQWAILSAGWIF
jgi:hypothetical protein